MADRRVPPRRRRGTATTTSGSEPRDFKTRLAAARSMAEATDDGYLEVQRDDMLDYCDLPMILDKWELRHQDSTYNGKTHCRVWAIVQVEDRPDPVFVKFRDMNGEMGDQLVEMERCRTFGDVAVVMVAREFQFGPGGMDTGYAYTFSELNPDGMNVPPPAEEPTTDDAPPY